MPTGALAAQALLHAPQLAGSVLTFTSQPFEPALFSSPSQSVKPASQLCSHAPAVHTGAEFGGRSSQATPQPPQLAGSVLVVVSQPSRATFSSALQSSKPALQAMLQVLARQLGVPLAVLQGSAQTPQWLVSVGKNVSHPAAAVQSP